MASETEQITELPLDPTPKPEKIKLSLHDRISLSIYLAILCAVLFCAAIPVYRSFFPLTPEQHWGTETEAIQYAEQQIRESLGWPKDREIVWVEPPEATIKIIEPPLDTDKRLWNVIGNVVVDENTTKKYHVSCCKVWGWHMFQRTVDGRMEFIDCNILKPIEFYYDEMGNTQVR